MITFLPYPSFKLSALALDDKRLGKQRLETKQLLVGIFFDVLKGNPFLAERVMGANTTSLLGEQYGWTNHPASKMWASWPFGLVAYGKVICIEWKRRGFKDNIHDQIEAFNDLDSSIFCDQAWLELHRPDLLPPWLNELALRESHRSNLIRKDPQRYRDIFGWTEPDNLPYYWPIK